VTEIAAQQSVYHAFELAVKHYGPRPFLRVPAVSTQGYADAAIGYSYDETGTRVHALLSGYAALDLSPGDRVAIAFDSRLEVYLHLLALNALGVSIVPLNSGASDDELLHVVGHSDAKFIVSLPEYVERFCTLAERLDDCRVLTESFLEENSLPPLAVMTSPATEAALLYTSGTTGKPKGCMLSNEYFLEFGAWYTGLGGICSMDENDRLLTPLPPNHMNALCTSFPAGRCVTCGDVPGGTGKRFHNRPVPVRLWWSEPRLACPVVVS